MLKLRFTRAQFLFISSVLIFLLLMIFLTILFIYLNRIQVETLEKVSREKVEQFSEKIADQILLLVPHIQSVSELNLCLPKLFEDDCKISLECKEGLEIMVRVRTESEIITLPFPCQDFDVSGSSSCYTGMIHFYKSQTRYVLKLGDSSWQRCPLKP